MDSDRFVSFAGSILLCGAVVQKLPVSPTSVCKQTLAIGLPTSRQGASEISWRVTFLKKQIFMHDERCSPAPLSGEERIGIIREIEERERDLSFDRTYKQIPSPYPDAAALVFFEEYGSDTEGRPIEYIIKLIVAGRGGAERMARLTPVQINPYLGREAHQVRDVLRRLYESIQSTADMDTICEKLSEIKSAQDAKRILAELLPKKQKSPK